MKSKGRRRRGTRAQVARIKEIIARQGQTYVSLAEEIGITPQAVSEIVNGRTRGRTARYALAKALGLEVRDLWPEEVRARKKAARPAAARRKAAPRRRRPGPSRRR